MSEENAVESEEAGKAAGEADEYMELELSEDDIVGYIEDEDGNQIGIIVLEDGKEVEYLYAEDDDDASDDSAAAPADDSAAVSSKAADEPVKDDLVVEEPTDGSLGITRDGVQQATDDMNAIFKDGVKVAAEMKGAFDDIKSALDFSSLLK